MSELAAMLARHLPKLMDITMELTLLRKTLAEGVSAVRELARVMEKRMEDVYNADT